VTLDTVGTSFDAILFLRSGSPCPGSAVTCDDNSAGGTPPQARITRTLDPGTYWILVDGTTAAAYGTYVLNATIADPPVAPPNDACAGAIPLALGNTLQSVTGDTTLATNDNVSCSTGGGTSPDVWYTFTLPIPHAVYLSTLDTNTWDTVIHVHSGSCTGPLTAYGCADDSDCATTTFTRSMFLGILPAGTYYVAVDGYGSTNSGPFTLFYQADTCVAAADASPITVAIDPILGDATYPGLTTGQGNDSTGSCTLSPTQTAPDVYYYVGLCPRVTVTMSTCDRATNYDTVLYARRGTCRAGSGSGDLACNNDAAGPIACPYIPPGNYASGISFGATGQGLYYVWVDGYVNPSGTPPADGNYGLVVTGM
jgi:hypothetical protein